MERIVLTFLAALGFVPALVSQVSAQADPSTPLGTGPLPSWNDGAAKRSIIEFVAKITKKRGPEFIPAMERIAVFDNGGTLWAEQPFYFQGLFVFDRVHALVARNGSVLPATPGLGMCPFECRTQSVFRNGCLPGPRPF